MVSTGGSDTAAAAAAAAAAVAAFPLPGLVPGPEAEMRDDATKRWRLEDCRVSAFELSKCEGDRLDYDRSGGFAERNSRGLKKKELELDTRYWYSTS